MWLMLVPLVLCGEAVFYDIKRREIPDAVSTRIFLSGILATFLSWHSVTLADAIAGTLIGFLAVLPFTFSDGIGGGDLKLVAALGAWLGASGVWSFLFWSAICGMVLAIVTQIRGGKDFPFAPGIAVGFLISTCFPEALESVIEFLRG